MFLFGGETWYAVEFSWRPSRTASVYDVSREEWSEGPATPSDLFSTLIEQGVADGDRIHLFAQPDMEHFIYRFDTDEWLSVRPAAREREAAPAVVWNDRIYVIGGFLSRGLGSPAPSPGTVEFFALADAR